MNGDVLEALGLDRERVLASAAATEDYAAQLSEREIVRTVEEDERGASAPISASALTVAGSLWSLVDPARGASLFRRAASEYVERGSAFATVLAICSAPRGPSRREPWNYERPLVQHPQPEALLLAELWPLAAGVSSSEQVGRPLDLIATGGARARAWPLGRLRIPLGLYLDVVWAIFALRSAQGASGERLVDEEVRAQQATTRFLRRAGEAIKAARADTYHWTRLRSGLLPVEPEAVAVSALISMTWRDTVATNLSDQLAEELELGERAPLIVAEQIISVTGEQESTGA